MTGESAPEPSRNQSAEPTVVAEPPWTYPAAGVAFTVLGAGLGWGVRLLADWLVGLPWAPMRGPAELVDSLPEPWVTIGLVVLGALAGITLAVHAYHDSLTVTVAADRVALNRRGTSREWPAERVDVACRDGKQFVLLDDDAVELAREKYDFRTEDLAAAFRAHGYRWADEDPYREEFRRWVPDTPGLPEGADALLKARAKALRHNHDSGDEARELRDELARLGVVVRDTDRKQYWRLSRNR
ncbi:hypothetical protein CDG81_12070 [Actinopolyspora erythraea]|uniref:DUF308 domain-containing protein n=1 Tax=Actinopolyspora erythraea TaxID=414996 RepID=A0A099D5M4_9ACTN|nr:hypothetical protein [Actinopolyspora erythraea]ASU78893.1 hypothetical protein CDG81_12070 [Actinopolyspora erythraea]KGI81241.1 hypothetical protein IL38_12150 [Actinopolyspora erythraea]